MEKEKTLEVLGREEFAKVCENFVGFLDFTLPCFNDTEDTDDKMKAANALFRQGLTDLKDFLRNLSLVPPLSK